MIYEWIPALIIYSLLLIGISWKSRVRNLKSVLRVPAGLSWLRAGLLLFATIYTIGSAGLVSEVFTTKGISGMWLLWSPILASGFLPIVFAPLWSKLDFLSENEFIKYRFAEPWSTRVRRFRSLYVGVFIVPILLSFSLLTVVDVLDMVFPIEPGTIMLIAICALVLNAWRTSFNQKATMDLIHLAAFIIPLVWVAFNQPIYGSLKTGGVGELFQGVSPLSLFVFLGIQWWSAKIFDGSGIEAQQLMGSGNRRKAILTATFAQILVVCTGSIILLLAHRAMAVGLPIGSQAYLHAVKHSLSGWIFPFFAVGLFGMFLSTFEALQIWGSGLVMDGMSHKIMSTDSPNKVRVVMACQALAAGFVSWWTTSLSELLELLLGLTAGVGLVYALRWFWWRVNAQVQLASMIIPVVLMVIHISLPPLIPGLNWLAELSYPRMMLFYTAISLVTIILVMAGTNATRDRMAFNTFKVTISPSIKQIPQRLAMALLFGLTLLILQVFFALWLLG